MIKTKAYNFRNIGSCLLTKTSSYDSRWGIWKRNESEIIAAKDQALQAKYLETQILEKKPRTKAEQRQGYDDRVQHTKALPLMKTELLIRMRI